MMASSKKIKLLTLVMYNEVKSSLRSDDGNESGSTQ